MYSVLIAEEKEHIRLGIIQRMHRMFDCFEIIGEAGDGNTALEQIQYLNPDIVIINCSLPLLDGLSCIESSKKSGYTGQFLIVTDYDNFTLVQKALRLGVSDYLLQPLNNQDFLNALSRLINGLSANDDPAKRREDKKKYTVADTCRTFLSDNSHWSSLVNSSDDSYDACVRLTRTLGRPFLHTTCAVFVLHIYSFNGKTPSHDMNSLLHYIVGTALENRLQGTGDVYLFVSENACRMNVLVNASLTDNDLDDLLNEFIQDLTMMGFSAKAGTAGTYSDFPSLKEVLDFCRYLLKQTITVEDKCVLRAEDLKSMNNTEYEVDTGTIEKLADLLQNETPNDQRLTETARSIIEEMIFSRSTYEVLKNGCIRVLGAAAHKLLKNERYNFNTAVEIWLQNQFINCETLKDFENALTDGFVELSTFYKRNHLSEGRKIISKIKLRINNEYSQNVKLSTFATDYFINQSYLSALFQQETGCSFSQYLTEVRLQKAKEILSSTSLSTAKVADMVGYNDRNYFATVFSKHNGMTPVQYRKRFLNNREDTERTIYARRN